jgi:hypothetical protein
MTSAAPTAAHLEAAGYTPFRDPMKKGSYYDGSWQKRIEDVHGKRYFITVSLWSPPGYAPAAEAECQFHERDEMKGFYCNVTHSMEGGIVAMERFFRDMWERMEFGYYERFEPAPPIHQLSRGHGR